MESGGWKKLPIRRLKPIEMLAEEVTAGINLAVIY
jgi:hypothetical protein